MTVRDHNNRSEKRKGHTAEADDTPKASDLGHPGAAADRDRGGTDNRHDGKSRNDGGGDGAGGAPKAQGQKQANKGLDNRHQNRGHG